MYIFCSNAASGQVESASVGPAVAGDHHARVARVAREAGLALPPRRARVFDELVDIVDFDLVLVMDKFDFEEARSLIPRSSGSRGLKILAGRYHHLLTSVS